MNPNLSTQMASMTYSGPRGRFGAYINTNEKQTSGIRN